MRFLGHSGSDPIMATPRADRSLPTGTVTFLFTDIEGSTRLWETQHAAMQQALADHDAIICDAIEANENSILGANREDVENSGLEGAMRDRVLLTSSRIKDMASGVRDKVLPPMPTEAPSGTSAVASCQGIRRSVARSGLRPKSP